MPEILAYNYASEIEGQIQSLIKKFAGLENNLRFVIPSRKDKSWFPFSVKNLWTWNEIYNSICNDTGSTRKKVLSPPDHLLIMKAILDSVLENCQDKLRLLPGLKRSGFLSVISKDIRELMNESIKPEKLTRNPESNNPSEFLLPDVYERYIKYLDEYDLLDSAGICTETLNEIIKNQSWGKEFVIIFVGFLSFNHSQLELVEALCERCREVLFLKPETNLSNFHDAVKQLQEATPELNLKIKSVSKKSSGRIIEIPTVESELEPEIIARTLALWSQGKLREEFTSFDDVGLMIDVGKEEAFSQAFERYGIPYDFTSGIRISRTLPGKILSAIKNLHTRNFPAYDTAMLLTQPCFAGIKFPVMRAYKAGPSGLKNWEEYLRLLVEAPETQNVFRDALSSIQAIKKFCDTLSRNNNPGELMKAFHEFLTAKDLWLNKEDKIADFPELDENLRQTASAIQTIENKLSSINELIIDIGSLKDKLMKGNEAYEFLENWCSNTDTRAPIQITNAVRIFTGNPPVLSHFPILIMTGVTQRKWSNNITSSPLLTENKRKELEANKIFLPKLKEKGEQREALFRRLIQTGEKLVIISRALLDDEGRPVSETPFMQKFLNDMPGWKENYTRLEPKGIKILLGDDEFTFPEIDAGKKILREPPKVKFHANFIGASDVRELLSCPFLWWQRKQAGLYEKSSEIVLSAEWGIMLHKVWECIWKRYRLSMNASGKIFLNIADDEWQKLLQPENEDYKPFAKLVKDFRLQRKLRGIEFRFRRLSLLQADIIDKLHEAGYMHEKILLEEEAHLQFNHLGVKFLGQCDRIEFLRDPDGEEVAFIVDYKDGKSETTEKGMMIEDYSWNYEHRDRFSYGLQLSLYASLFAKKYDCRVIGLYILGLEDGTACGSFSTSTKEIFSSYMPWKSDGSRKKVDLNILARVDEGNYAMNCAASVLKSGIFAPEYQSDMCGFCSIKSLCRKGEFRGEIFDGDEE